MKHLQSNISLPANDTRFIQNCLAVLSKRTPSGEGHNRLLLIWCKDDVINSLSALLPKFLIESHIMMALKKIEEKENERKQVANYRKHIHVCDICGSTEDVLESVYYVYRLCSDCIENDIELSAHKWEMPL